MYVGFPTQVLIPVQLEKKKEGKHDKTGLKQHECGSFWRSAKDQLQHLHAGFGTPCSLSLLKYIFVSGSGGEGGCSGMRPGAGMLS